MSAYYDNFDYPSYWEGRDYEHKSEIIAINSFLKKINKIKRTLEIGAGYGRLYPTYSFRSEKIVLTDPSSKLLKIAKKNISQKNTTFTQSTLDNLPSKYKNKSFDLIVLVRVLHHIKNIDKAFEIISKLLKTNGYLLLEFPNKNHFKAFLKHFLTGDLMFSYNIFTKDMRCVQNIKNKTIPFANYHPDLIFEKLQKYNFNIIEKRSVSNTRSPILKKYLPESALVYLEEKLQFILGHVNFGPSIFVLAQKV